MSVTRELPKKPAFVLRVAFVGNRNLPPKHAPLQSSLEDVFEAIIQCIATLAKEQRKIPSTKRYYSDEQPMVRLMTGLAEGADTLAWTILQDKKVENIHVELAAVLGCEIAAYRDSRAAEHVPIFDKMLQQCSYVIPLDGTFIEGDAGKPYRARLYRSQAMLLLRQADVLVAMADPQNEPRSGGTIETIGYALHAGQPVVFINSATGEINLIETANDFSNITESRELHKILQPITSWQKQLKEWLTTITAGPDIRTGPNEEINLLEEFFNDYGSPRYTAEGVRKFSYRERYWSFFEGLFKASTIPVGADKPWGQFSEYRKRATHLNYRYAGLYRGAFLVNYTLAALAVAVAAICLSLLKYETSHDPLDVSHGPGPITIVLITLGCFKLLLLALIVTNSRQANKGKWNDKAVAFRYLAERLRNMLYLPLLGSFKPPLATPPQYSGYFQVRQSQADWLFNAIVRSVPPSALAEYKEFTFDDKKMNVKIIQLQSAKELVTVVKDGWIKNQIDYHDRNSQLMESMNQRMEKAGMVLNTAVLILVFIDILLLVNLATDSFPGITRLLHAHAVWILFCAAVFPVMVASLNSIRFQSECERLALRSAIVRIFLGGKPKGAGGRMQEAENLAKQIHNTTIAHSPNPGSWIVETMLLGESVAQDLTREVAEWGMLYAKEMLEP